MTTISNESLNPIDTEQFLELINERLAQNNFDSEDSELLRKMVESLADKRGLIRLGFVEAFGKIDKPATPFLLQSLANHVNPVVRRSSGKALAKIQDPLAIPTLIRTSFIRTLR